MTCRKVEICLKKKTTRAQTSRYLLYQSRNNRNSYIRVSRHIIQAKKIWEQILFVCHTATAVAVFIIRMYSQPLVLNHYFMVRSRSYISDDTETK